MNKKLRRLSKKHTKKISRRNQKLSKKRIMKGGTSASSSTSSKRSASRPTSPKSPSTKPASPKRSALKVHTPVAKVQTPRPRGNGSKLQPKNILGDLKELNKLEMRVEQNNNLNIRRLYENVEKKRREFQLIKNPIIKQSVLNNIAFGGPATPLRMKINSKKKTEELLSQKKAELNIAEDELQKAMVTIISRKKNIKSTKKPLFTLPKSTRSAQSAKSAKSVKRAKKK